MPVIEIDITPYAGKPVSQGVIDFFTEQLEACKIKASKQSEFEPRYYRMVEMVNRLKKEKENAGTV
jgi:hypothetical protein